MKPLLLAALLALHVLPAAAGESIWIHNGSIMSWESQGQDRWVRYLEPRPGLAAIGVQPGTLLFQGKKVGNRMFGTAFVFHTNCPPAPYPVEGVVYDDTSVMLQGPVPMVDQRSCTLLGYTWENSNSALQFNWLETTVH